MPACSNSESPPAGTLPSGGKRKLLPVTLVAMAVFMGGAFGMAHAQDTWTTAQLSVSRIYLSATSVENEALFAGGDTFIPSAFFFVLEDVDALKA
jgi:hypothetical protein